MAMSGVSFSRLESYRALARAVPTSPDAVGGAIAPTPVDETMRRSGKSELALAPYVNTLGEITGTTINATA
jgi:hypothetical protein